MYRYRVLLMLTALLATATAVSGQAPTTPNVQPRKPIVIAVPGIEVPFSIEIPLVVEVETSEPGWHVQAWQEVLATCQRARAIYSANQRNAACCEAAVKAARCVAGSVKGIEVGQAPKACACAKECACCEACKASKAGAGRTQAQPPSPEMIQRIAGLHGIAQPQPFPIVGVPPCASPMQGIGIVVHVGQVNRSAARTVKPVHFVTPDLDAHCERMHHQGDMVVLEGNVLLLCKKHAQPIRIEAQRVIVNMKDGSFRVESNAGAMPPSNFGVQRTSGVEPSVETIICDKVTINTEDGTTTFTGAGSITMKRTPAVPQRTLVAPHSECIRVPAPLIIPVPAPETQRPDTFNADELFRHLMRFYR